MSHARSSFAGVACVLLCACACAFALACERAAPPSGVTPSSISPTAPPPADDTGPLRPASPPPLPPPPARATTTDACDALVQRFRTARARASGACSSDSDCGCFNGVDPSMACGGVTDRTAVTALAAIEDDFHRSECKFSSQCAPWQCEPKCVQGRCMR